MTKRNYSSKRNAIYDAVCQTKEHPSARRIYETLKPYYPDLSLGTVYRNLSIFKDEGKVQVVCNVNGEERIDSDTFPHPHFVCNECGRVYDVEENTLNTDNAEELRSSGFKVESKYVIYYGLCPACSDK